MLAMAQKDDSRSGDDTRVDLTNEEIGRALKGAREAHGWSQRDMGRRMGELAGRPMSGQAYARYESGGVLKPRDLADACKALGITIDELDDYIPANVPLRRELRSEPKRQTAAFPVHIYGTPRIVSGQQVLEKSTAPSNVIDVSAYFSGSLRAVQAPDDVMNPMVQQGQLVFFDVNTIARRGDLTVIEMADGALLLRILAGQDGSTVQVTSLWPEQRTLPLPLKEITGLYQVRLRAT